MRHCGAAVAGAEAAWPPAAPDAVPTGAIAAAMEMRDVGVEEDDAGRDERAGGGGATIFDPMMSTSSSSSKI